MADSLVIRSASVTRESTERTAASAARQIARSAQSWLRTQRSARPGWHSQKRSGKSAPPSTPIASQAVMASAARASR